MTVKLELLGVKEGRAYPVTLVRAGCGAEGDLAATLDTPHVGTVGVGSSMTRIPASTVEPGGVLSIRVSGEGGGTVACGEVRTPAGSS